MLPLPTKTLSACKSCDGVHAPGARFCATCGAALISKATALPTHIGEYEVQGLVGEGGMGRVYRALQPRLKRSVCIKTLLPQFLTDATLVQRFENEALTTASLRHPNIVQVFDVGRHTDGAPFIVMEHIDGITLRALITNEAPLPFARAAALVDHVLAGLAEAHAAGMVHRDLKPANVMLVRQRDGSETCKVLDFGIARSLDAETGTANLTQTGLLPGTPGYIAPEQVSGVPFDHRADLYSAGVMLYELLCGKRPYSASSEAMLLQKVVMEDPAPPSSRTPNNVPAEADAVVSRAMAREPNARFQSASEFRQALARLIGGEKINELDIEIDCTPLASLMSVPSVDAGPVDLRPMLANVLESDDWERSKMLEVFTGRLRELFADERVGELHEVLHHILASKHEAISEVKTALTELVNDYYAQVVEWLARPERRKLAAVLLRSLGKEHVERLLGSLVEVEREQVSGLYLVLRTLESPRELLERVSRMPVAVARRFLEASASLSDVEYEPLLLAGLRSASHDMRLLMLEGLTEARAFRFVNHVRSRLHDPEAKVRAAALRWLHRLEDEGAVPELRRLLARPSLPQTERLAIYRMLEQVKGSATDLLVEMFPQERDEEVQREVAVMLAREGSAEALELLRNTAHDATTTSRTREACRRALSPE